MNAGAMGGQTFDHVTSVRYLDAVGEALPALHESRLRAVRLRERRELHRVVHDEGGTLELWLDVLGQERVDHLRPGLARIEVEPALGCRRVQGLRVAAVLEHVYAGLLPDRLTQRHAAPRSR